MPTFLITDCTDTLLFKGAVRATHQVQELVNEELVNEDYSLEFTKPFLPEQLAHTRSITCLDYADRLLLNQIRGNSYLHLVSLLKVAAFRGVSNHAQSFCRDNPKAMRAHLELAAKERKHVQLFHQLASSFEASFGTRCESIGPSLEGIDLAFSPLSMALLALHLECMAQSHFLETVQNNEPENLDPQFYKLLHHPCQSVSQLDSLHHPLLHGLMAHGLMAQLMAETLTVEALERGIDDYLTMIRGLNAALINQVQFDLDSLEWALGSAFSYRDREAIRPIQERSYQQAFLVAGMAHPRFLDGVRSLTPTAYDRISEVLQTF